MKKQLSIIALLSIVFCSACGSFNKKCDCPRFGKAPQEKTQVVKAV